MTKNIVGKRYDFQFCYNRIDEKYCEFYIKAICKITKRISFINNLNAVLSELYQEQEDDNNEFYMDYLDSTWIILEEKAKRFTKIAENFLISPIFMPYLENKLDDDRKEGEWENIVTESGEIKEYEEEA